MRTKMQTCVQEELNLFTCRLVFSETACVRTKMRTCVQEELNFFTCKLVLSEAVYALKCGLVFKRN